jgi:hypothetical protein
MVNISAEHIIRVFGTVSGNSITSIGFRSTKGFIYGPYGPGSGEPFTVDGLVLGFFGALNNRVLSGIGVWYTPMTSL